MSGSSFVCGIPRPSNTRTIHIRLIGSIRHETYVGLPLQPCLGDEQLTAYELRLYLKSYKIGAV